MQNINTYVIRVESNHPFKAPVVGDTLYSNDFPIGYRQQTLNKL